MSETEKFTTARLVARSWRAGELPFAMELWGDPAVTALIDSRSRLTADEVEEKLHVEIERERTAGVQYWALFERQGGGFVGCCGLRPWALAAKAWQISGVAMEKRSSRSVTLIKTWLLRH